MLACFTAESSIANGIVLVSTTTSCKALVANSRRYDSMSEIMPFTFFTWCVCAWEREIECVCVYVSVFVYV